MCATSLATPLGESQQQPYHGCSDKQHTRATPPASLGGYKKSMGMLNSSPSFRDEGEQKITNQGSETQALHMELSPMRLHSSEDKLPSPKKYHCCHQEYDAPELNCNSCEMERSLSDVQLLKKRISLERKKSLRRCHSIDDECSSMSWFRHRHNIQGRNLKRSMSAGCTMPTQKLTLSSPTIVVPFRHLRGRRFVPKTAPFPALPMIHTSRSKRLLIRCKSTPMIPTSVSPNPKRAPRSNSIPLETKSESKRTEAAAADFDWEDFAKQRVSENQAAATMSSSPKLSKSSSPSIVPKDASVAPATTIMDIFHWERTSPDEQDRDTTKDDMFDWKQWAKQQSTKRRGQRKAKRSSETIRLSPSVAISIPLDASTRSESSYFISSRSRLY